MPVRFLRRAALICLKREAGGPQDLADIGQLILVHVLNQSVPPGAAPLVPLSDPLIILFAQLR